MTRIAPMVLAAVTLAATAAAPSGELLAVDAPADRVVAMYFHRTKRCPTCLKMGSYSEEAVKTGFAEQLKDGTVELHYVDFQDKKNAALTKAYRISGPALVVAKVAENKVAEFKDLKDIWTKVGDKKAFLEYVQENIAAYRK
ncbi:MAG: hypothetical protein A2V98_08845 [Planctomycetes bacterium RBG_16_64_12]|nr:MAG: hypothetical protein A2V98_08845 [Planctomycetes bacterium RBG_16_64_12]